MERLFSARRLAAAVLFLAATVIARAESSTAPADKAAALVRQLADDAYASRQQAAQQLAQMGLAAREALLAGLRDGDPHLRRSCRRLLADVLETDWNRRLAAFVAEDTKQQGGDLPCWQQYREAYGNDKPAREVFVQMQRAEGPLLESAALGGEIASQAFRNRWQQVLRPVIFGGVPNRRPTQPSFGTLAALTFSALEMQIPMAADFRDQFFWPHVFHQAAFQKALQEEPTKAVARKLLARWVVQPGNQNLTNQKLQLAVQYQVKEALPAAVQMLQDPKTTTPQMVAMGIEGVARLGGKEHATRLVPLLADDRECFRQQIGINGRIETRVAEIRDVALAWLVELTGQDHARYGRPEVKQWFSMLRQHAAMGFNFYQFGMTEEKRNAALKLWQQWAKDNPLPDAPSVAAIAAPPAPAAGQPVAAAAPVARRTKAAPEGSDPSVVLGLPLADREHTQKLAAARQWIEQKQYAVAAQLLGDLLAEDTDYCFRGDTKQSLYRRLKVEAEHLLGQMPEEGLAAYEEQFGSAARRRLQEAVRTANVTGLADVVQQYFHTSAGGEATYLLGMHYRRSGQFLRAAYHFRRLEEDRRRGPRYQPALGCELAACYYLARLPESAEEVLVRLRARQPAGKIVFAGHERELFADDAKALAWLAELVGPQPPAGDDWPMPGGSPARVAAAKDCNPFMQPAYKAAASDSQVLNKAIARAVEEVRKSRRIMLPMVQPLVVGQRVIVRTPVSLRALDFNTGAVQWETPSEDPLERFMRQSPDSEKESRLDLLAQGLKDRLWEDRAFGVLASDGRSVFALEEFAFHLGDSQTPVVSPDGRRYSDTAGQNVHNLLTAYDLKTGKVRWELGGPPSKDLKNLAGALFLGPPLPVGDQVYIVAQTQDQTRLLSLDGATGAVEYQWLFEAEEEANPNMAMLWGFRRSSRETRRLDASLSYADGVLVCHTGKNRYVAVDLTTRSVLWMFESPEPSETSRRRMAMMFGATAAPEPLDRWSDPGATIAEGRVLLTLQNSEELICLDLNNGALRWSVPRRDGLFVGGVHDGKALVVGRESIWAVTLAGGKPAWPKADRVLFGASAPSGRGYLGATRYYVPLTSAEIVAVDVVAGRIAARSRSPVGLVPGNLVACRGAVFSQDGDALCRLGAMDARLEELARRLREHPTDARALADHGEALLCDGRMVEALDCLQRAWKIEPADRTEQLLVQATAEALQHDPAKYLAVASELDPALRSAALRGQLLRELAVALSRAGKSREAFETCLKWIDLGVDVQKLHKVTGVWTVRSDRWVHGRLAELLDAATPDQRAEMDRLVRARLRDDRLPQFLAYFSRHAAADEVRLKLAAQYAGKKQWLEAEQLLQRVLGSGNAAEGRAAVARLAAMLAEAGRPQAAAPFYDLLRGPLAAELCLDGKRGQQLFDALTPADPVRQALAPESVWSMGEVKRQVTKAAANRSMPFYQHFPALLDIRDRRVYVGYASGGQTLIEYDSYGRKRWELNLNELKISPHYMGYAQWTEGRAVGTLLVALVGNRVCAIDTLGDKPRLLWSQDSFGSEAPREGMPVVFPRRFRMGRQAQALPGGAPQPLTASSEYVCFEQDRKLVALDPPSGQVLWIREDVPSESDLFGDEEMVFATGPSSSEAKVFSALDGRELGTRPVPSLSQRVLTLGRRVLVWDDIAQSRVLRLLDPWDQKTLWENTFDETAKLAVIDAAEVGVLDGKGVLTVFDTDSGRARVKAQMDRPKDLHAMVLVRTADRYIAMTHCPKPQANMFFHSTHAADFPVSGTAQAFDRVTGKLRWSAQLPEQSFNICQPDGLPVLIFFRMHQKMVPMPNGMGFRHESPSGQLFCLDKRTGKIVCDETGPGHSAGYQAIGDPAKRQVEIKSQGLAVTLSFGDAKRK